ncbi:hypothetical protein [Pandoraea terrigena]|uniref:Lipoprotein n=1 Tax=Pandoraea terrigena TaxID=2508292 RepID=A0A5E4UTD5_9BURK|nr:hypothetical protein [Pandoraea terrigena]VVE02299.1 hypothetical protein PTE31013_02207 [Pandoraea terrigena]
MKTVTTMMLRCAAFGASGAVCLSLAGCMSSSPIWDAHMGEAVRNVMHAQIVHPGPPTDDDTRGTDGRAAVAAMNNYDKSLRTPTPTASPFVIGVSSGGAAMSPPSGDTGQ